jgi:hypothetical protein
MTGADFGLCGGESDHGGTAVLVPGLAGDMDFSGQEPPIWSGHCLF